MGSPIAASMARWRWPVCAMLASVVLLSPARGEFISLYNQELVGMTYACPVAMAEHGDLLATSLGTRLIEGMLRIVFREIPSAIDGFTEEACDRLRTDFERRFNYSVPGFVQEECLRTMRAAIPEQVSNTLATCNEDRSEVERVCATIEPGMFCLIQKRLFPPRSIGNPADTEKEIYCVLTVREQEPVNITCPPGFYCKGGSASPAACTKGKMCTEGSVSEQPCVRGSMCLMPAQPVPCNTNTSARLHGAACELDKEGKVILPDSCDEGKVCNDGKADPCPEGHFCMQGTATPIACEDYGGWVKCTEGSAFPKSVRAFLRPEWHGDHPDGCRHVRFYVFTIRVCQFALARRLLGF